MTASPPAAPAGGAVAVGKAVRRTQATVTVGSTAYFAVQIDTIFDGDWSKLWNANQQTIAALGAMLLAMLWYKFLDRNRDGVPDALEPFKFKGSTHRISRRQGA